MMKMVRVLLYGLLVTIFMLHTTAYGALINPNAALKPTPPPALTQAEIQACKTATDLIKSRKFVELLSFIEQTIEPLFASRIQFQADQLAMLQSLDTSVNMFTQPTTATIGLLMLLDLFNKTMHGVLNEYVRHFDGLSRWCKSAKNQNSALVTQAGSTFPAASRQNLFDLSQIELKAKKINAHARAAVRNLSMTFMTYNGW